MKKNVRSLSCSLSEAHAIHVVGIGGIGVSALVGILHDQGKELSGSDKEDSAILEALRKKGIKSAVGHAAKNIPEKTEIVIHSLAIPSNNPELVAARKRKLSILTYPEAVGQLTRTHRTIAVCGTHGKSTVTAMISKILIENGFDPTVIVGTRLKELNGENFRVGARNKLLILEACEFERAFLNYRPQAIVMTTLDYDHFDSYKSFDEYLGAFRTFSGNLPRDGYFFANIDDDDVHDVMKNLQKERFPSYNTFSYSSSYGVSDFYLDGTTVIHKTLPVGKLDLKIPGQHNRMNALAAFALAATFGITPAAILKSLNAYAGASRRFELKGKMNGTTIIDDYGHHPAEIIATLEAARERFPGKRLCVVFQPHQYNRTRHLLKEFGTAFSQADCVIIPNIYEARDSAADKAAVSSKKLIDEIRKHHASVVDGGGLDKTISLLKKKAGDFDVIITMGAGDVWKVAEALVK